jgi:phytoene dehydrogenase-like protein
MAAALDEQFPGTNAAPATRDFIDFSRRMFRLSREGLLLQRPRLGRRHDAKPAERARASCATRWACACTRRWRRPPHKHVSEPHVAQMVEHFLQYVGSSPFLAPAILSLIASAQVDHGCWYPMGGAQAPGGTRMVAARSRPSPTSNGVEFITGARSSGSDSGGRANGREARGRAHDQGRCGRVQLRRAADLPRPDGDARRRTRS